MQPYSDAEYIEGTKRDLVWLRDKLSINKDETSMRMTNAALYRLLVEGALSAAWHRDGQEGQLDIVAPSMNRIVETIAPHRITFAQAGGARLGTSEVSTTILLRGELSEQEKKLVARLEVDVFRKSFSVDEFTRSACMVIDGKLIPRRELLEYLADKYSGTPWDKKGPVTAKQKQYETSFAALEKIYTSSTMATANAIFYELLSIAQVLNTSPEVQGWL